jgi:hypothetical protein
VRNINDGNSAGSERSDDFQKTNYFTLIQRGSRLIHNNDSGLNRKCPGDLHQLLLTDRKSADRSGGIDVHIQRLQNVPSIPVHRFPIDDRPASRFSGDKHVLGNAQMRQKVELLKNYADPGALRTQRISERDQLSIDQDLPGTGL